MCHCSFGEMPDYSVSPVHYLTLYQVTTKTDRFNTGSVSSLQKFMAIMFDGIQAATEPAVGPERRCN